MRKQLPAGAVVAAPVELLLPISALTPQYVYTCGTFVPLVDTEFFETLCHIRGQPTYAERFTDDETRRAYLQQVWPDLLREPKRLHLLGAFFYYNAMMSKERQPIFNKTDPVETTIAILDACRVQYVLAPPAWASYMTRELQPWGKLALEVEVKQPDGGTERWIFLEKKR